MRMRNRVSAGRGHRAALSLDPRPETRAPSTLNPCFRWPLAQGCVVSEDKRLVDTKATVAAKAPGGGARPPQTKNEPQEKRKPLSIDELLSAGKNSGGKGGSAKTDKGLTFSSKGFQKKQKKKK